MKTKPSKQELIVLWNNYIQIPSFEKRLHAKNTFTNNEVPSWLANKDHRREFMASHSYKTARPILKPLFIDSAFKKLCLAYGAYQYKKLHNLATINIDQNALRQLNRVMSRLGLNENDSGFSDAIDWLTSPGVREEDYTSQVLLAANNGESGEVLGEKQGELFYRYVHLLRERMCHKDQILLKQIIDLAFFNGWFARGYTRSIAEDRIKKKLLDDPLYLTSIGIQP